MFTTSENRAVQQLSTRERRAGGRRRRPAGQPAGDVRAGRGAESDSRRCASSSARWWRRSRRRRAPPARSRDRAARRRRRGARAGGRRPAGVGRGERRELDGGLSPARLLPDFGAAGVRRMGGTAAKLLVRVRADREDAAGHNAADRARGRRATAPTHDLLAVVEGLVFRLPWTSPRSGTGGGAGADPRVRGAARGVRRPVPEARVSGQRGGLPGDHGRRRRARGRCSRRASTTRRSSASCGPPGPAARPASSPGGRSGRTRSGCRPPSRDAFLRRRGPAPAGGAAQLL